MILPIYGFGHPVLRKETEEIEQNSEALQMLIKDMFDTMYHSRGVGLAAPQIGKAIRLFLVDATPFEEEEPVAKDFKKVFINPIMVEEKGELWTFNEGCLSIPNLREDIKRKDTIIINYLDEDFIEHEEVYDGIVARIIQHEYDHLEGKLFIDKLTPFKKTLVQPKLDKIMMGKVNVEYDMIFVK